MEQPLASGSNSVARAGNTAAAQRPSTPLAPATPLPSQDLATLSQLRRGNWSAMEDLVHRYQDRLFTTILRIVGHPEDAADLVQETFVRAIQHVSKFEGKSTLYTWLFRIAVNLSLSHRRAAAYRKTASIDADRDAGSPLNGQAAGLRFQLAQRTETDPAVEAEVRMEHEELLQRLLSLDAQMCAIIVLRDIEECDYEQIGEILDIPVGTVKSRLFRACAALRVMHASAHRGGPHAMKVNA